MALKIKEIKQEEERSKKLTFKEKKKIMSRNERKVINLPVTWVIMIPS